jgi:hypothetical protein
MIILHAFRLRLPAAKYQDNRGPRANSLRTVNARKARQNFKHDAVYLLPSQKRQCSGVGLKDEIAVAAVIRAPEA